MSRFSPFDFRSFFLPLSFRILTTTMMCLGLSLVPFILLLVYWACWVCSFQGFFFVCLFCFYQIWEVLSHCNSQYFFCFFLSFHTHVTTLSALSHWSGVLFHLSPPLFFKLHSPLHYSRLKNPMDRGGWWAIVQRVAKSRTWLSGWPWRAASINLSSSALTPSSVSSNLLLSPPVNFAFWFWDLSTLELLIWSF